MNLISVKPLFYQGVGFQCGCCTPEMTIALKALFREIPNPADEEIAERLLGNICRCTGYGGIMRAAHRIRKEMNRRNTEEV